MSELLKDPSVKMEDTPRKTTRQLEKEAWEAWWKVMDIETQGNYFKRFRFNTWKFFDTPVTWWREKVEKFQENRKLPYYHRKFKRGRTIEQCSVTDLACRYEANWQYKLDKLIDGNILMILKERYDKCLAVTYSDIRSCAKVLDDWEEADLNFFIKYGELGFRGDVVDAYMKQKHRMIWERRHPKLMAERERAYKEHKANLAKGIYDSWFWRRGMLMQFRNYSQPVYKSENQDAPYELTRDNMSQDPMWYKEKEESGRKEKYEEYHPWDSVF